MGFGVAPCGFPIPIDLSASGPADGVKTVFARAFDAAGNVSIVLQNTIILDTTPPFGPTVTINNGAEYADSPTVHLALSAQDSISGVSKMAFSTDGGASWSLPEDYFPERIFTFSSGQTVCVRYTDTAGNPSPITCDTILIDLIKPPPPVITKVCVAGEDPSSCLAISRTNRTDLQAIIIAEDAAEGGGFGSGVSEVKLADGADGDAALTVASWRAHNNTLTHVLSSTNGDKSLWLQSRDRVDHESPISAPYSLVLDTEAPYGHAVSFSQGAYSQSSTVTGQLEASDNLDTSAECPQQIAFADRIVLNKIDLVPPQEIDRLEKRVLAINAQARLYRAQNANVPLAELLDVRAFDLDNKLAFAPDFLKPEYPFEWGGLFDLQPGRYELELVPGPDPEMDLLLLPVRGVEGEAWEAAKQEAVRRFADDGVPVLPGDCFVAGSTLRTLQLADQGGGFSVELTQSGPHALFTQHGPEEFAMQFRRDGRELRPNRAEAFAAAHSHDDAVTSVGITEKRPVDGAKLNEWLSALLRDKGTDIYRMKGILHVQGQDHRLVFQGVHMLFTGKPDRPWKNADEAGNQLIFIGKNLDRAELNRGFKACLA